MKELEDLLSKIRKRGHDVWLAGPASTEAITKLEEALNVSFPPSYVEFLSTWGGLGIYDNFVSGIIKEDPLAEMGGGLYGDTLILRSDFNMPPNLLVVGKHEDGAYCFDSSHIDPNGEWQVVNFEVGSNMGRVSGTFKDWLVDFVLLGWANEDA